jgi:dihydrofolate reductase
MEHDLVDEYRLLVFPIVLGSGRRLFRETSDKTVLRLVGTKTPYSGTLILTYRPGEEERERDG